MPREIFEQELQRLQDEVLALGEMVEQALVQSVDDLKRRDQEAARRLIAADDRLNEKRFAIESDALMLIATQQPMASDLRVLAAILAIASELERIGDYAKGIAQISLMIGDRPLLQPLMDIPRMAETARRMLHCALEAFARRDVALARSLSPMDDEMDALYNQTYRVLLTYIMADPAAMDQVNHLLWVAHNLERTADRAINICERVVFTVTGEMEELDVEEGQRVGVESMR